VAQHNSQSWLDISHKDWKDFFNRKDIALIWGDNISVADYKEVRFSHGDFTVYWSYSHDVKFKHNCIANNHLISDNAEAMAAIMLTEIGDQVEITGYLARYSHSNGAFERGTSVTREDTGPNSCEVIYVTNYQILKEANTFWRAVNTVSKYVLISSIGFVLMYFLYVVIRCLT
jgi:hypothetical protein